MTHDTVTVVELSSFQLELIQEFRTDISVFLNLTPDHLDRHHTVELYGKAKARIFENQREEDFAILNADDPATTPLAPTRPHLYWFSRKQRAAQGAFLRGDAIVFRNDGSEEIVLRRDDVPLPGAHNLENVLAAIAAARVAGASAKAIAEGVRSFTGVEHRLEFVTTIRGVDYYNDSKATNVDATIKALESFPANIHLILGGKDKGSDYTVLNDLLRQRVKRVYTIGAAAAKIESQIVSSKNGGPEVVHAETLENAIRKANAVAQSGDVVLLAPACASFDQFKSYEHRGKMFKEIVRSLAPTP